VKGVRRLVAAIPISAFMEMEVSKSRAALWPEARFCPTWAE